MSVNPKLCSTLVSLLTNYTSTFLWPNDFNKTAPYDVPFTETNYFNYAAALCNAKYWFQDMQDTIDDLNTNTFDPLTCNTSYLRYMRSRFGLQFVISPQTEEEERYSLQARKLANCTACTTEETVEIIRYITMEPTAIWRWPWGHMGIFYVAVDGAMPMSYDEFNILWRNATAAGYFISLATVPSDYFNFTAETDTPVYNEGHGLGVLMEDGSIQGGGHLAVLWSNNK